jgi:hypothetical protein
VKGLKNHEMPAKNPEELSAIRQEVADLNRVVSGASRLLKETSEKLSVMSDAILKYPNAELSLLKEVRALEMEFKKCEILMNGDKILAEKEIEFVPSMNSRLGIVEYQLFETTSSPTKTQYENLSIVKEEYEEFKTIFDASLLKMKALESKLDLIPIPYTKEKSDWKEE